jgi:uncharacterized protein (DUF4415 family)
MNHLIASINQLKLPILCDLEQLKRRLKRPDVAVRDLLPLIEHDPIVTMYLQRLAGDKQKGRSGEITGLEHALSMCGIEAVKQLIAQLRSPESEASIPFRQVAAESILASKIAARLAVVRGLNEKEHQAAALFARANEWILYWNHPRRSWQARRMMYRRPWSHHVIFDSLFHIQPHELQLAIAEQCYLPFLNHRLAQFSLNSVIRQLLIAVKQSRFGQLRIEDLPRELRLKLSAPEMTAVIANRLAQASCSPWLVNAWGRWVDIAAIHCRKTSTEIVKLCVQSIRQVAQTGVDFAEFGLASALVSEVSQTPYEGYLAKPQPMAVAKQHRLKKTNQDQSQSTNNRRPKSSPTRVVTNTHKVGKPSVQKDTYAPLTQSKTESKPKREAKSEKSVSLTIDENAIALYTSKQKHTLLNYCKELLSKSIDYDVKNLLRQSLDFVAQQTPLERVSFILLDREPHFGRTVISATKEQAESDIQLTVDLETTVIWKKFIQQPAFLVFDKTKHAHYWQQLPQAIVSDNRIEYFLLHSIRYGGRIRGFFYADMALSKKHLPEDFINDVKFFVKMLSGSLNQLVSRSNEKNRTVTQQH